MVELEAAGPLSRVRWLVVYTCLAVALNCSELIELKCSNVTFKADNIVINVQPTRTDQYQEGPVHHAGGQLYALACKMMETYTCTFMWES